MPNIPTAIVTGGASGLGLAIANQLMANGIHVVIFDKDKVALEQLPASFSKFPIDITDSGQVSEAIHCVAATHKKIDILINNAGVIYNQPLINIMSKKDRIHSYEKYKKIIDINLNAVFLVTSLVAEKMVSSRTSGVIVNISSICAKGNAGQSAYSAAKAGVNSLTRVWAKELGVYGIRVIAVSPGFIDTASTKNALNEDYINALTRRVPLRKLGQDSNVANLVLSAINNDYITGAILDVHGGYSL